MTASPFLKLDKKIAADERGGIGHRWNYGRELLKVKGERKQLPHGMIGDLVAAAARVGIRLSEREIQRRIKCATVYDSEAKVRQALTDFGSWSEIVNAGFPAVMVDEPDDLDPEEISTAAPDSWEQMSLIPGLAPTLKVNGRRVQLADATVSDVEAYRDTYAQIHANFGKRLDLIEQALQTMRAGSDDPSANALDAWRKGAGDDTTEENAMRNYPDPDGTVPTPPPPAK